MTTNDMSGFEKHKAECSDWPVEPSSPADMHWLLAPQLLALWEAARKWSKRTDEETVPLYKALVALEARADEIYRDE